MRIAFSRFLDERGAAAIEYGLVAVGIWVAINAVVESFVCR
jgi:Flp pilus assembly pilin Flp